MTNEQANALHAATPSRFPAINAEHHDPDMDGFLGSDQAWIIADVLCGSVSLEAESSFGIRTVITITPEMAAKLGAALTNFAKIAAHPYFKDYV